MTSNHCRLKRPHLQLYLRWMDRRGLAPATIGRRFTTVAGLYRYAVIDGHCEKEPSLAVTRPRVPREGRCRTVLHPLEHAALLTATGRDGRNSHALVALLGMIGLRVSEATNIDVTDLRSQAGYELLTIMGKGAEPALIPLPVPVLGASSWPSHSPVNGAGATAPTSKSVGGTPRGLANGRAAASRAT